MRFKIIEKIQPSIKEEIFYIPLWKKSFFSKWKMFYKQNTWESINFIGFSSEEKAQEYIQKLLKDNYK